MDDRAHDTEQEIATDLKKFRTGRCSKCVTKRWPQVFSSIVAETGCLAVKAAGFLERESKHFCHPFPCSSFSLPLPSSLLVKSTDNLPVLLSEFSHFMVSQLSTEYFRCRSTPVIAFWKYFFQEETSLPKCEKADKFTGEIIAKQMCWWYLKNHWQLLLAEIKQL